MGRLVEVVVNSVIYLCSILHLFSTFNRQIKSNQIKHQSRICIRLKCMAIGHHYFSSKWYSFAPAMTPLHGGATSRLKCTTHPHYFSMPVVAPPSIQIHEETWAECTLLVLNWLKVTTLIPQC